MSNNLSATIDLLWKGKTAANQIDKDFAKMEKSIDDTDKSLKDATRTTDEFNKTTQKTERDLSGLTSGFAAAGVAIVAVGVAAKEAYEFIGEGAELDAAAGRFDNLSGSIGTTADALLTDMQAATGGMISDAKLIAGATDIINTGLGDTHDETVRLATAVGTLGLDMETTILTFANNSKARLDSLGLSISDVDRVTKELQATGMGYDEAFDEAVLILLEEKMTLLGDASETTAGQMKVLESEWANVSDQAKITAAVIAGPVISGLSSAVTAQIKLNEGIAAGVINTKEWNQIVNSAANLQEGNALAIAETSRRIEYLNSAMDEHNNRLDAVNDGIQWTIDQREAEAQAVEDAAFAYDMANSAYTGVIASIELANEADAERVRRLEEAKIAQEQFTAAQVASYELSTAAIGAASKPIKDYFQAQQDIIDSQGEWVGGFRDNSSEINNIATQLYGDLTSDERSAWDEILATSAEGGAEWLAAYESLQADLTDTQRNELIARQGQLQAANGEAISLYTGDAAAYKAAQEAKIQANQAVITSLKEVSLATIEAQVTEAVAAGEITAAAANAYLAGVGEGLGLLSEDEAEAQIAVGNAALEMQEVLANSLNQVRLYGEGVANDVGVVSGEVAAAIAEDWNAVENEAVGAQEDVAKIASDIDNLPDKTVVEVEVRYTTTGTVPSGAEVTGARAGGGGVYESGSYIVGETGPELVTLPKGAHVTNAQDYRQQSYTFNTSSSDTVMRQLARQGRRRR